MSGLQETSAPLTDSSPLSAIGICGYSHSGKTTLIEKLIPHFMGRGLSVAVFKHDVHGLVLDKPGKDSDRLYQAGADIVLEGPEQSLARIHGSADPSLAQLLTQVCRRYDLVLVEGRKWTPQLKKIWLRRDENDTAPPEANGVQLDLGRDEDRVAPTVAYIEEHLTETITQTPVYGGILVGGASSRMGTPKHALRYGDKTWFERALSALQTRMDRVVVLGDATLPDAGLALQRLPDVPGIKGPRAGMLAAMRWAPSVSWIFAACDMPLIRGEAIDWLLGTRVPGTWATLPGLAADARPEPLLAHYDCRARALLEAARAPHQLSAHEKVNTPTIPPTLAEAWRNLNEPGDLESLA